MLTALRHLVAEPATSTGHRTVERSSRRDFAFSGDPLGDDGVWLEPTDRAFALLIRPNELNE